MANVLPPLNSAGPQTSGQEVFHAPQSTMLGSTITVLAVANGGTVALPTANDRQAGPQYASTGTRLPDDVKRRFANAIESEVIELVQIDEPARVDDPECGDAGLMTAADVILKLGTAAMDAACHRRTGHAPIVDKLEPRQPNWLKVRLGLHDSKSSCATQCIVYPASLALQLIGYFAETGWNRPARRAEHGTAHARGAGAVYRGAHDPWVLRGGVSRGGTAEAARPPSAVSRIARLSDLSALT